MSFRLRRVRDTTGAVACIMAGAVVLLLCVMNLSAVAYRPDPGVLADEEDWMGELIQRITLLTPALITLSIGLVVCALGAVFGAFNRLRALTALGVGGGAAFAVTLIVIACAAGPSMRETATTALDMMNTPGSPSDLPVIPLAPEPLAEPPAASLEPPATTPIPSPSEQLTSEQAREETLAMVEAAVTAADGMLLDPDDREIEVDDVVLPAHPCGESGAQYSASLAIAVEENEHASERILAAWDEAGYSPDDAMQQHIRYSESLPVERMTLRDRTTIDGLIHLTFQSRCASAS